MRMTAVHPGASHAVIKLFEHKVALTLKFDCPAPLLREFFKTLNRRAKPDQSHKPMCLSIALDVALDLRSAWEKVKVLILGIREAWELIQRFGHLETEVVVVLTPNSTHIFGFLENDAFDTSLNKLLSCLQPSHARTNYGHTLHPGELCL